MTTNTKLEERFDAKFPKGTLGCATRGTRPQLLAFIAQERAQVVKEAREALPKERDVAEPWDGGWNSYRDAALEALSRIGQEHE